MKEVLVGKADTVFEFGLVGPTESSGFGYIQQFAGSAIRTSGVPFDTALVTDDLGYEFSQFRECCCCLFFCP